MLCGAREEAEERATGPVNLQERQGSGVIAGITKAKKN